jgi:hypothetical protein
MENTIAALGFFATLGFALAIMALFTVIAWAKDLDKRVTKLEQENEKTD